MEFSNIPRKYILGGILAMIIILVSITAINPGSFIFPNNTDYDAQRELAANEAKEYEALLASVEPDYNASQQLLKKIASEDVVRQEVESTMRTDQKIVIPQVPLTDIKVDPRDDAAIVVNYINQVGSMITNYNESVRPKVNSVFNTNADSSAISQAQSETKALVQNIRGLSVPASAVALHSAEIVAYEKYIQFLSTAENYAGNKTQEPWADVYGQYAVIDNRLDVAKTELSKLQQKYAFDFSPQVAPSGLSLLKTANAAGWPVIDLWNVAWEGIRAGLAKSFANFSIKMLDKLVSHIEKNFAIASQLYYSNELGRYYSVEYMKKFVTDPLDQDIIQKFLPQYFCVNPSGNDLKKIFTAKARANQGTDMVIDPNDPQYLQKLARLGGDEKNYEGWWEDYYTSLAAQTQREAEAAATKEVISPGLKTGRDLISGQINKTMSSIFNVQEAAISNTLGLGTNNADNPVGQIVAGVVEGLVNKFVFTPISGGASGGGGIGVATERNVCISVPKIKPIASVPGSEYPSNIPTTPPIIEITPLPTTSPR